MRTCHIDVVTVPLTDQSEDLYNRLCQVLSENERMRSRYFRFKSNRIEYTCAHSLKRFMLSTVSGLKPSEWRFQNEPNGKPIVSNRQGLHFNLSHCKGLVACAVSADVSLGIDIEPMDRLAWADVASRYFAASERSWLSALPKKEQDRGFIALWTLKEAFVKATGKGIVQGLNSFAIDFDPLAIRFLKPSYSETANWHLEQKAISDSHYMGLAWHGPEAVVMRESE